MTQPRNAAEFAKSIVRQAGRGMNRAAFADALDVLLPESQRSHCQVLGFRDGHLTVEVDSAPLFAELTGFRREELRQRINDHLGGSRVAKLTFRLGGTASA